MTNEEWVQRKRPSSKFNDLRPYSQRSGHDNCTEDDVTEMMGNKDTKKSYFNNIRTNTKGPVYSMHTRFLDIPRRDKTNAEIKGRTNDEVYQPKARITHRRVESLSHLGRLDGTSRFNNLFWLKKASASGSFTSSEIASSEKTPSSGHYRENDSDSTLQGLTTARIRKEKFRFISLPGDIREMLYDFILFKSPPEKKRSARKKPAFLRALEYYGSKDLHEEAKIAFYSINTFS